MLVYNYELYISWNWYLEEEPHDDLETAEERDDGGLNEPERRVHGRVGREDDGGDKHEDAPLPRGDLEDEAAEETLRGAVKEDD